MGHPVFTVIVGTGNPDTWDELPIGTAISGWTQERNSNVVQVTGSRGGLDIADGLWAPGELTVTCEVWTSSTGGATLLQIRTGVVEFFDTLHDHIGDQIGIRDEVDGQKLVWPIFTYDSVRRVGVSFRTRSRLKVVTCTAVLGLDSAPFDTSLELDG